MKRLLDLNFSNLALKQGHAKLLMVLCFGFLIGCHGCRSTTAPIRNGDLTSGTNTPDYWQSNPGLPGVSVLRWHHSATGAGELEIDNIKPNDAHWTQVVHLDPGWYLFTASVRAEAVPSDRAGANLSSLEDGIISTPISGTTEWKTLGFYLKVGKAGADLPIACRLGGYSSPNTGKAFFRNVTGTKVEAPSQENVPRYDLDTIRGIGLAPVKTAAPNPTRPPAAEVTSVVPPAELLANEGEHAGPPSKRNILLERSIDVVELTMSLILVLATLYAGVRMLIGGLRQTGRTDAHSRPLADVTISAATDTPSSDTSYRQQDS